MLSVDISPSSICEKKLSIFSACCFCNFDSRSLVFLNSATSLAFLSLSTTNTSAPESGTPDRPRISTGVDGPASLIEFPLSSTICLTLPDSKPAITISPFFRVPDCTSIVVTLPLPLSSLASNTTPLAGLSLTALISDISAVNIILSRSSSIPSPVCAETGTIITSPPQSSAITSCVESTCFTLSGSAPSLSILLIATIIGTPADLACLIDSMVCGITPSSAATTRIMISVAFAPRDLILENAACPGVSINVMMLSF